MNNGGRHAAKGVGRRVDDVAAARDGGSPDRSHGGLFFRQVHAVDSLAIITRSVMATLIPCCALVGCHKAPAELQVAVVDEVEFSKRVAQHRGKVVLVDFWATWCGPCRRQFPHTVALSQEFADEGLVVISMSMDEPEQRDSVLRFLRKQQGEMHHWVSAIGGGSRAMEAFQIESGSLPHYKIYDRGGEIAATFSLDPLAASQFTADDIKAKVKEILAR